MQIIRDKFPHPVDQSAVSLDWRARGYSCGLFVDPPGREWNGFVHTVDELVTVVDGRLRMTVNGEHSDLAPGDEVLIPRNTLHSVKNIHTGESRWLFGYG